MLRVHHALESYGLGQSGVQDVAVKRAEHDNILDVSKGSKGESYVLRYPFLMY